MITWAASDGRESGGDVVVPAASTIYVNDLYVERAFAEEELARLQSGQV